MHIFDGFYMICFNSNLTRTANIQTPLLSEMQNENWGKESLWQFSISLSIFDHPKHKYWFAIIISLCFGSSNIKGLWWRFQIDAVLWGSAFTACNELTIKLEIYFIISQGIFIHLIHHVIDVALTSLDNGYSMFKCFSNWWKFETCFQWFTTFLPAAILAPDHNTSAPTLIGKTFLFLVLCILKDQNNLYNTLKTHFGFS